MDKRKKNRICKAFFGIACVLFMMTFFLNSPLAMLTVEAAVCDGCGEWYENDAEDWNFCVFCMRCEDCVEKCDRCSDCCIECHELLGGIDDSIPCPDCLRCKQDGTPYCEECGRCEDCVTLCEACGSVLCLDCHDSVAGDGEELLCPDCELCKQDGRAYCPECDRCEDCTEICSDCGLCMDCVSEIDGHCPECALCYEIVDACHEGGEHCVECCEADGYLCPECGICTEAEGIDLCIVCGYCENCCKTEVEIQGCSCEEICWYELTDEHFCMDCGVCFGEVSECDSCFAAEEIRCTDCCEELSKILGCDCDDSYCSNEDGWTQHQGTVHGDFEVEHSAHPAAYWTMDTTSHWHECRWCDSGSHITSKASHTYDANKICTVCGYGKTDAIIITRQPKDRTAVPSYNRWGWPVDDTPYCENKVTFVIDAYGKDGQEGLSYQWYRVDNNKSYIIVDNEVEEYARGAKTRSLTTYVPFDACCEGVEYYYYCVVTDEYGNEVTSERAKLTGRHQYAIIPEEDNLMNPDGHLLYCVGYGCGKTKIAEHNFRPWSYDNDIRKRFRTCQDCYYYQTFYLHEHDKDFSLFYEAQAAGNVEVVKESEKQGEYIYQYTYEYEYGTKTGQVGANRTSHWVDCSFDGCNHIHKEEHDWGNWRIVVPATETTKGGIYATCTVCGYEKNWSRKYYEWHTHPVNVEDGTSSVDFAEENALSPVTVTVIPDRIDGLIATAGTALIEAEVTSALGVTTKVYEIPVVLTQKKGRVMGTFDVPASRTEGVGKDAVMIDYQANVINVSFTYDVCPHLLGTTVINKEEVTCEADGYTGDTVCATCYHLISQGTHIEPKGHGNEVPVTETVYATDVYGNILKDRNGLPIYKLRAEETVYCDEKMRGSYTGDTICEDCGELLTKGKLRQYSHYYKLLNDYNETQITNYIKDYGYKLQVDPTIGVPGYSGDRICTECGAVEYGRETNLKTINKVELTIDKYPAYGETLTYAWIGSYINCPNNVRIAEIGWRDPDTGNAYYIGSTIDNYFVPEKLELYLELEPAENHQFRDYEYTEENQSIAVVSINGAVANDVHGTKYGSTSYGTLYVTIPAKKIGFTGGTVHGIITDEDGVGGATIVQLKKVDGPSENIKILSGSDGMEYSFVGVESGTYTLIVERDDCVTHTETVVVNGDMHQKDVRLICKNYATITTQPKNVSVYSGETASVTVKATGDGLTYKWYYKNVGDSGFKYTSLFKGSSYSITMDSSRAGRQVYCVVTDKYKNKVTSKTVTLGMKNKATITKQPTNVSVYKGETAKVTVKATGDGLTYKWYYKNVGDTSFKYTSLFKGSSYSITMDSSRAGRQVYCVVTDKYKNKVTSNTVTLGMKNKATITKQPTSVSVYKGETAKVTVKATGDGLTYKWYYKNVGDTSFKYTSLFKGSSYSITMDSSRAGRQVYCVVTDKYKNKVTSKTVTLGMKNKATITKQPTSVTVSAGTSPKFTVTATGDGLKYQWQVKTSSSASWKNTTTTGCKTKTITVSATKARSGYSYRCIVTDKYGNKVTSSAAKLTVK